MRLVFQLRVDNMNIVSMPQSGGACKSVIERLQEALDMAKDGKIANVMVVMVDTEDNVMHGWANGNRPSLMIGELYCATNEFMMAHTQRRGG